MSVLFKIHRGRALLGATVVLATLALASTVSAVPPRDQTTTTGGQVASEIASGLASAKAQGLATSVDAARAQGEHYASYGHPATPAARVAGATHVDVSRPSWLGFALAAGGALLIGIVAGRASTVMVRRTRAPGMAG